VKGLRFENLRDAGDPVEAATRYEAEGADEIAFLDIAAAHEERGTLVHLVTHVADVLSIPFTVGGGVRSVEDAGALLRAGADRVVVNTAAVSDPALITRIAERFGSQCVVVAVDGKRVMTESGKLKMLVTTHGGRRTTEREVAPWAVEITARGAGEILLTSVDADGTQAGFDVEMLRSVRSVSPLPIVASGGAGRPEDFARAVLEGGADAVLAASVFHDRHFSIGAAKRAMRAKGVAVRLEADPFDGIAFDADGLVPVVVRDVKTGEVLTLAWASAEALETTRSTGFSHFFSRKRKRLWKKGETSGHVQRVTGISLDCDGDALVYDVVPSGPACHTGSRSCFRNIETLEPAGGPPLSLDLGPLFEVVRSRKEKPVPNSYTNSLFEAGITKIAKKVGEEGVEAALAALGDDDDALAGETADLLYHLVVLLTARGVPPDAIERKLRDRRGTRKRS
jgi:anthranilate synthase component 1